MKLLNKSITHWLRIIHRDLGYFVTGICLIYAISGILLNHMNEKDPAYRTEEQSLQIQEKLSQQELMNYWQAQKNLPVVKKIMTLDENHSRLLLEGGVGVYNHATGWLDYEVYQKRPFIWWMNRFHYNKVQGWSPIADIFAGSLIFLAISGLFMVKGKNSLKGRGKWYLMAGLAIPILYVLLG